MNSNYKLIWFNKKAKRRFLDKIFRGIGIYCDGVIRKYYEAPFGYSERAFVGYIAQVVYKIGWWACIEYECVLEEPQTDGKQHFRPDVYVGVRSDKSFVLEAKQDGLALKTRDNTISKRIQSMLEEAHQQLCNYRDEKQAEDCCCLAFLTVTCTKNQWKQMKKDRGLYVKNVKRLRKSMSSVLKDRGKWMIKPNFIYSYFLNQNDSSHKILLKGNEPQTLGFFCIGRIETYRNLRNYGKSP